MKEIDKNEWYSASEIARQQWLWGWGMTRTITIFLESEEGRRILKPLITMRGSVRRYRVQGSDILEALRLRKEGKLLINHGTAK